MVTPCLQVAESGMNQFILYWQLKRTKSNGACKFAIDYLLDGFTSLAFIQRLRDKFTSILTKIHEKGQDEDLQTVREALSLF